MNEENKRENIREEIDRAMDAIKAAQLLFENGFVRDAISKLYYSLLYSVRALLLAKGLEPKSHEGALRLFGQQQVDTQVFGKGLSVCFGEGPRFSNHETVVQGEKLETHNAGCIQSSRRKICQSCIAGPWGMRRRCNHAQNRMASLIKQPGA